MSYPTSKKWENPFYYILGAGSYEINKNIDLGLATGLYLFDKETHYFGIKRTFAALPILSIFDFHLTPKNKSNIGVRILPGILVYNIDDTFIKVNTAFIFGGEIYYEFSTRFKIQIG